MVALICPYCGELTMDGTPNMREREWYETHHPDVPVGSALPMRCSDCSHSYAEGETAVLRNNNDLVYTVKWVIQNSDCPPLVAAADRTGGIQYFATTQIRPLRDVKTNHSTAEKKAGYF
ncbi:MAG: hypothetical protein COA78_10860 [Blastopirellula sp.]|nr:MAG: hypothetical protein COA78_10860 [Blastopirellula sp.]